VVVIHPFTFLADKIDCPKLGLALALTYIAFSQTKQKLTKMSEISATEEREDILCWLAALSQREAAFYLKNDYLSCLSSSEQTPSRSGQINQHWREVMCEWAYNGKMENVLACRIASGSLFREDISTKMLYFSLYSGRSL
jgi:hypothetical protein